MGTEAAFQFAHMLMDSTAQVGERFDASDLSGSEVDAIIADEELMRRVGEGARDALAILFDRHGRSVLNVAWRILRDEAEAADLRQDVFLYVFQHAHLFDAAKSSASSWIIQITYHRAIDRRRHLTSRQHYSVAELDEARFSGAGQQLSIDELDGRVILKKLRDQLSPDQRQTLELHFFEGYSLREIAEKSGQSLGNVRHHYYRALERLRSNLFSKKQG